MKKLTYIVNNWEDLPLTRFDTLEDKNKALLAAKIYLGKAANGKLTVRYSQKDGIGRHRASIGQQTIMP
eukprot:48724-Eustigmatos_ZCMA.PRE.1